MVFLLFFNLGVICLHMSYAEIFTAVADFESLLDGHKKFIDNLEPYVEMQEKKLFIIKGYLDLYSREQVNAMKDVPKYLSNPVNAFIIIKRLVSDLNYLCRIVRKGSEYVLNVLLRHERTVYPDRNDLIGAAEALFRLQKTYNLDVRDLANGNINNRAYRLTCHYLSKNHPFLKIAPFKVETKHLNPDIFLFHDVLTDSEIRNIKELGRPLLQRAKAFDDDIKDNIFVSYRISKLAWLYDGDSDIIDRISQRVSDMTGLSVEYAEPLQLCNYGIGGHYEPHLDFSMMSDVDQGGATVFPTLGLTIYPIKGTAIFWFNMYPSGAGNKATRHAACPVLQGDKWVSSKWIHQYGQEFIRPCNLNYQEDSI
ncbi:unnamed protein product [Arctia plantaginis]|uniref:procollagen-proline 4-dioxygenase n=1 Tax=Arctia plantaginis TaxID=874455 RepID=A0A8S0YVE3_ARCPL|nr:unnamed protein product [Arctia plantaginis]